MGARFLGAHMPNKGGLGAALRAGHAIGCSAAQVFTSSPRQWKSSPPSQEQIIDFKKAKLETGIDQVISHDSYLVNLVAPDAEVAAKSFKSLKDEMVRCSAYSIDRVVSHIGSYKGRDLGETLLATADVILAVLDETPSDVTLLMETTAGQGSDLNSRFEELATLLDLTHSPARLGVCLDTCHVFVAGYELRTLDGYETTFSRFHKLIGLDKLKAIHVNDSVKGFGSRVDRHADIGLGELGPNPFRWLVNDPRLENIPMTLETEAEKHEMNLATLRSFIEPS